ncbi:LytTR family DNA-binding domain-containing protein [Myxococcota bacterium]|nr:LytTR family DNA-binding domain-containing protein [Myxococcota bacterium]
MIRALIVDDEPLARSRLARMLGRISDVEVVGEAADGVEARALVLGLAPDVLLLDIQMPELDGLSLAAEGGLPPIIFTTAHREHALEAFELAAIDYLLKPIEQPRLEAAIERVRARTAPRVDAALLRTLVERITSSAPVRLAAKSGASVRLFDPAEVTRLWASDKYTLLAHEGREHVLDESLAQLEQRLAPHGFFRVHRAELVNLAAIRGLRAEDDGGATLELSDGQSARVSRRFLPALKAKLGV